jgi:hypothetical protein
VVVEEVVHILDNLLVLQVPVVEVQEKHTHLRVKHYMVITVLQTLVVVVEPKEEQVEVE